DLFKIMKESIKIKEKNKTPDKLINYIEESLKNDPVVPKNEYYDIDSVKNLINRIKNDKSFDIVKPILQTVNQNNLKFFIELYGIQDNENNQITLDEFKTII